MQGCVHIYTGNGKGKTTAALGLALRAAGAGLKVYFGQFLKKGNFSEIKALRRFPEITVRQFGCGRFIKHRPTTAEIAAARRGLSLLAGNTVFKAASDTPFARRLSRDAPKKGGRAKTVGRKPTKR